MNDGMHSDGGWVIAQNIWGFHLVLRLLTFVAESLRSCCTRFPPKTSRSSSRVQRFPRDLPGNKQFHLRNGHPGPARPLLHQGYEPAELPEPRDQPRKSPEETPLKWNWTSKTWRPLTSAEQISWDYLSSQDKETCDALVHRLHRELGHIDFQEMLDSLRQRKVHPTLLAAAKIVEV